MRFVLRKLVFLVAAYSFGADANTHEVSFQDLAVAMIEEDNETALKYANKLLERFPKNEKILLDKVSILLALDKKEEARSVFDSIKPEESGSRYHYFSWLLCAKELEALNPKHPLYESKKTQALSSLSRLLDFPNAQNSSNLDKAEAFLKNYPDPQLSKKVKKISKNL